MPRQLPPARLYLGVSHLPGYEPKKRPEAHITTLQQSFREYVWSTFALNEYLAGGPLLDPDGKILGVQSRQSRFGGTSTRVAPHLWGGYSQYLYMPPNTVVHKLPSSTTPDEAAFALPLANGVQWAHVEGEAGPGRTVVIQGPGPKGLGCTLASKIFGADCIIVTGLTKDAARLEMAKKLGADYTIDVQKNDFTESIREIVG